ncbi:DUF3048 domain-containing protein [Cohnella massiliensis]|uniref:DUF3048 domain-containing protein n=1 Tax=Cohnella massiliensis TaxID=1816691 RepID=UPI0009BA998D|nr:DUF3048 domain-containing protein [Cohnella massiliensis]
MRPVSAHWIKRSATALVLAVGVAALSACGGAGGSAPGPDATPSAPVETSSASPKPSETAAPAFIAPLTGLPVYEEATKRPLAVMINNLKPARPQSGLSHADIVWEVLAEGGITRLVSIFQSSALDEPIGPIRSIRPYMIDIGEAYGGVLVHAGASNDALAILQHSGKADLDEINNASAYFYRESFRKAPHNLYSTIPKLREGTEKLGHNETADVPAMTFRSAIAFSPEDPAAADVEVKFQLDSYKVSYRYDPAKGTYARSINGEPHTDLNNDEQLAAANLVMLSAKHRTYDSEGRLEINLQSGGEALLFQQGRVIVCEWERESGDIVRLVKDGAELPFAPGKTYYHVLPSSSPLASLVTYQ